MSNTDIQLFALIDGDIIPIPSGKAPTSEEIKALKKQKDNKEEYQQRIVKLKENVNKHAPRRRKGMSILNPTRRRRRRKNPVVYKPDPSLSTKR